MAALTLLSLILIAFELCAVCSMTRCRDGEFMTDPESCSHYYVCDHGRPVRFACGEGTYYSPDLQTCDHKGNVDCGDRPRDSGDRSCNNGDYNNGSGNNEKCSNNDESGNYSEEDSYWKWTDEGTMYNPLQTKWGPNNDVPASAIEASEKAKGSPTVDSAHETDHYYNWRGDPDIDTRE